ncbi:MAG: hypothetical protein R8M71_00095 [Alphaproteobacteria bacterium]|nr:hypothetical protein [Alphaproteobacteria bacterium]
MRFLKTFFRFFTIVTLCTTFTTVAWGADIGNITDICSTYTNATACQNNNCQWNSSTRKCTTKFVLDNNCENYTGDVDCEAQKGCSWKSGKCVITPVGEYNDGGGTQLCPPNPNTYVTYWESGMQSSLCRYYRPACAEDEYFSYSDTGMDDQCKKCDVGEHISSLDTYDHVCFNPAGDVNNHRVRNDKDYYWCTVTDSIDAVTGERTVYIIRKNWLKDGVKCLSNSYNLTLELQYDSEFNDGSKVAKFTPENIVTGYLYDKDSNDITSSQTGGVNIDLILNNHLKGRFSNVSIKSKYNGNLTIDYNTNPKKFKTTSGFDKKDVFKEYADKASVPFVLDVTGATKEKYTYYIVSQNVEAQLTSSGGLSGKLGEFTTGEATYGQQTLPTIANRDQLVCTAGKYVPTSNITYTAYIDCEFSGMGVTQVGAQETRTIVCNANNKRTLTPGTGTYYVPPPSDARELTKQQNGLVLYNYKLITVLVPQEQDCSTGNFCSGTGCAIQQCATGEYQDAKGQSSCKSCSTQTSGKYTSSAAGSDAISDCYLTLSNGKYVPTAGGGAQDCPAGSYCSKLGTKVYHSTPNTPTTVATSGQCAVGKYSGKAQTSCSDCGAGKKTGVSGTGATSCTACDKGTFSDGTANASCTACAAGKYQDATGQSSCKDCGAGKKTGVSGTGATTCSDCDAGTYSSGTANTTCTPCAAGYHQDATGKSSCKPCNNGQYQDETGKTSCKNCADGKYTPKTPVTASFAACISCASNEISNSNHNGCDTCQASDGQISHNNQCRVCPSGTKVNTAGNGCEVCASGTYNESAKGSCDSCGDGFITDTKANTDPATTDIATTIGASAKKECYLNPKLMLTDSINDKSGVTLESLSGYGNNIYYVKPSSQQ